MNDLYGINTLNFLCSAHATDGSLKSIAKSETMCIDEVKSLYNNLKSVLEHFSFSVKSKKQLDQAIEMLEMRKGVHLISWCATRMAHFLTACVKVNELLVPLYNAKYSSNMKPGERDKLFNAESLYTLKLLVDVKKQFYKNYLCPVDKENHLASTHIAQSAADRISTIDIPNANTFIDSMKLDQFGNLSVDETVQGQNFTLHLSNSNQLYRNQANQEKLEQLKIKLCEIRLK